MELTNEEKKSLEKIQSDRLKGIYLYLVHFSQELKGIEAKQTDKTTKLSFRYFDGNGDYPFSFIVNQKWLLFYFRSLYMDITSVERELRLHSIAFEYNNNGDIKIKIQDESPLPVVKKLLINYFSTRDRAIQV